jgi:putative hydrolase of the HAD superfamily
VVFIDDQEENVEGARNAGMTGILFTGADDLRQQLEFLKRQT